MNSVREGLSDVVNSKTAVVGHFGGVLEVPVDSLKEDLQTLGILDNLGIGNLEKKKNDAKLFMAF